MTTAADIASAYPQAADMAQNIVEVSNALSIDPSWLANVIKSESNFNPQAVNPDSQATGLIQFMPFTAKRLLGTATNSEAQQVVYKMDANAQLGLTYLYLLPYKGKMKSQLDVILAVFYPAALGKGDNFDIADHYAFKDGKYPRGSAKYIERRDYLIRINAGIRYAIDYFTRFVDKWNLEPAPPQSGMSIGVFLLAIGITAGIGYTLLKK
tara:strand:- start:3234 stop:3863 length:630 start_codon:yes stop_codon:yes gene_type:complete